MDTIIDAVKLCLPCSGNQRGVYLRADDNSDIDATAAAFVQELLSAEKPGVQLERRLDEVVGATGWNWEEGIAKAILTGVECAIKVGAPMAEAMAEALAKATVEAVEWSKEHPVYTTLIVFGILVILSPWVLEALGFAELGPLEGTFASWWQARYAGQVPKGSLFAFFQRLGMIWRRYPKMG